MIHSRLRPPTWLLFLATGLIWGASFLFIKIGVSGMNPGQLVVARVGLGAITLTIGMALTRTSWIRDKRVIGHLAVSGVFQAAIPLLLFAWAAQYIPSGLSAIFNATTPLLTLVLSSLVLPSERLGLWRSTGVAIGAIGIVVVVGPWRFVGADLAQAGAVPAYLACLGATTCYAISFVYLRRFVRLSAHPPLALTTVQILSAFAVVGVASPALGIGEPVRLNQAIVVSVALLGVFGTGIAYMWNTRVTAEWGAVRASMVTYVTPVVGVVLGVSLLGEALSWNEPVGMVCVFTGIAIAQGLIRPPARQDAGSPALSARGRSGR